MDKQNFNKLEVSEQLNYLNNVINSNVSTKKLVIPNKVNRKPQTQSFTVTMNIALVEQLDRICKEKGGYNRNEIINMMCQWCVNNLDEQ